MGAAGQEWTGSFPDDDGLDFQATAEGILDGPLSRAVSSMGPRDRYENGFIGSLAIMEHVDRFLADAYGQVAHDAARRHLHRDLADASGAEVERRVAIKVAQLEAVRAAGPTKPSRGEVWLGLAAMAVLFALGMAAGALVR